jgi:hypothetical protein
MLALFSSIFGFLAPFLPELVKHFQRGQEQAHELAVLRLQMEAAANQHTWRMDEISATADILEAQAIRVPQQSFGVQLLDAAKDKNMAPWLVGWVFLWFALLDFVSGITRPLITWSVFGCYAAYRYAWFLMTLSYSQSWQQAFMQSWGDFDQALLQMVLSYWFGERVRKAVFGGNASHGGAGK